MALSQSPLGKMAPLLAALVVCPPWVWLALRTKQCLGVITGHSIPFSQRTVWLIKILALIVGAGNVAGVLLDFGTPWFLAIVPAAIVVFVSLKDSVSDVIPPKPPQDQSAYESAWREYWRLRGAYKRSGLGFALASVLVIVALVVGEKLGSSVQIFLFVAGLVAVFVSMAVMSVNQWKWLHWRCPRCGCSFRGALGRLWLPKKCAYCGLPREEQDSIRNPTSESSLNS